MGTGRRPSHLTSVILSEVVVREADDNAVEGPAVRSDRQQRFREFSLYRRHRENAFRRSSWRRLTAEPALSLPKGPSTP